MYLCVLCCVHIDPDLLVERPLTVPYKHPPIHSLTFLLMQIPDILRALSPERIKEMHARLVFVYETFFKSLGTQVLTGI